MKTKATPYHSQDEYSYFRFFVEDCGNNIAGFLDKDFWTRTVPQLSQSNNAVRYAVLAISCLYKDLSARRSLSLPVSSISADVSPASIWYNKAIKAALSYLEKSCEKEQVALITCLLFLCIECIQGHDAEALNLFKQGQNLVQYHKVASVVETHDLEAMFTRFRHGAALFNAPVPAHPTPEDDSLSMAPMAPFDSIFQARDTLHEITTNFHNFVVTVGRSTCQWPSEVPATFVEFPKFNHLTQLATWLARAQPLLNGSSNHIGLRNHHATLCLLIHYPLTMTILPCALSWYESAYDANLETFQEIIDLASQLIELKYPQSSSPAPFTFETHLIPALSLTALHCRHPQLRRTAAEMLRKTPRQEGLWEADLMRRICERVIELEHTGLDDEEWPTEEMRVRETFVCNRMTRSDGRTGNMARFSRMPNGIEGEGEVWEEWFDC